MLYQQTTLNCAGKLINLGEPIVMGILNRTPDSFYDGNYYPDEKSMLQQVDKMIMEGAIIIDIGGMSSRPNAALVSPTEELKRTIPAIKSIKKHFPETVISIDTCQSEVALQAVNAGADVINDISGGIMDDAFFQKIASLNIPYVLTHIQGTPQSMQNNPTYEDVVQDILDYFIKKIGKLQAFGLKDIIIDPGFGFGKTISHNYELLNNMHIFKILEKPILAGLSRKSMIYKPLRITPQEALNGTTALHMIALQQGAKILRTHDVKEAIQTIQLIQLIANR